jgi:LCP family protein required for cell wall assembly
MRPVPSPGPAAYADHSVASAKVRFRRALALLLMTLVLPGSAQLVAGHRTTGRVALRVWLGLAALVTFVAINAFMWHGFGFWLGTYTSVLAVVRFGLCLLAVGWAFLFLDAWRLGQPLALLQRHRLAMVGINGLLCFSVAGSLLFVSHVVAVQRGFILSMFGDGTVTAAHDGRYNVLLLGGDSGADRWGLRPDSITVASIDANTGRTILFGLPRNMLNFPFAKGSIMAKQFPHGYRCGTTCELNSLATWAADHKPLFKGVANPGVEATAEAVEGITGLKVNYYAMVNLQGFRSLVQAMGGLTLNVRDRIPIGGVGGPITGYLPPGVHKLNGFQTLWFARSRESADDYSRMARQKCVMNAMLQQLSPRLVVTKFEKIAKASEQLITTDLPASELGRFAQLALKARSQPVSTVSFVPPLVNSGHPDVASIKLMVRSAIKRSVSKHAVHARLHSKAGFTRKGGGGTAGTVGGSIGNISQGYAANQSTNLSGSC